MKKVLNSKIFEIITNERSHLIVKSNQEKLEQLFKENKIFEYRLLTIYNL